MHIDLNDPVHEYFRLTPVQKIALKKLGIESIKDLLYHFPARYGDTAEALTVDSLKKGEAAVIYGKVSGLEASKGFRTKMTMAEGVIEDETGKIHCVWFNQPYLAKMFSDGMLVRVEGKVSERRSNGALYFSNPKIERVAQLPRGVGDSLFGNDGEAHSLYPVYPESRGISSLWLYHAMQKLFKNGVLEIVTEIIPDDILKKYNLPGIKTALIWIHAPKKRDDALAARKRFSFEEIFTIQLGKQQARKEYESYPAFAVEADRKNVCEFVRRFPFQATGAQNKAIEIILGDMQKEHAMSRLLEGDVGSGKTAVAAAAAYAVVTWRPETLQERKEQEEHSLARTYAGDARNKSRKNTNKAEPSLARPSDLTSVAGREDDSVSLRASVPLVPLPLSARLQVAYMCPTEILAIQHFESFIRYFAYLGIQVGLITSSGCRKFPSKVNPKGWTDISRAQLLSWVENGEIPILIGTHALIQKSVKFKYLAFVIIDEQHRFGTFQRAQLVKKSANQIINEEREHSFARTYAGDAGNKSPMAANKASPSLARPSGSSSVASREDDSVSLQTNIFSPHSSPVPHLLSMTATPIPRTLALTMYGDLDLTLLDESPAGRKQIITEIVLPGKREEVYEKVRLELQAGRQAYVICPRIDEPDPEKELAMNAKSVKEEARRLKGKIFPEYEIGVLHGRMRPKEKDKVMDEFNAGKMNVLCATSVVEVGVNVPNATVILIEGAERFGLAQLHQLRGRVQRSTYETYCYAFTETSSAKSIERLKALSTAKNGFELAELDLAARGSGTLSGMKQWGVSDVAMEALKNQKMVEAARTEAARLIGEDSSLETHPNLKKEVDLRKKELHFE